MYLLYLFLLIVIHLHSNDGFKENECYNVESYFSQHLATKTPYRFVLNKNDSTFNYDNCEPKKIWMVIRHGTRNPGEKMITKMKTRLYDLRSNITDNHKLSKGTLCKEELANLTSWAAQIDISDQKRLVHEGEDEMVELAERFQSRFPSLLPNDYSNSTFKFRFTATQRTKESQRHFTIGLFDRKVSRYVWTPEPLHEDPILRFYKLCNRWKKEVDKNPDSLKERKDFESSDYMKKVIIEVSNRLGFDNELMLEDVQIMYMTCAFESAWNPFSPSPWCSAFTEKNMEALEYAEDLEYYYIDGYGYPINYEQACPLVKDLLETLTSKDGPKSTFYFTHSGTLLKILAHLGLYRDERPLTHNNFNASRLWKVGKIDAFATNLAFVLYQCSEGYKILTLHQERPVILPGCPEKEELCPLDDLIKQHNDSLQNCKFSEICQLNA